MLVVMMLVLSLACMETFIPPPVVGLKPRIHERCWIRKVWVVLRLVCLYFYLFIQKKHNIEQN